MSVGNIRISKHYVLEYLKAIEKKMLKLKKNQSPGDSDEMYYI